MSNRRRGFTLVEAMLVVALIGILAGVGGVYMLSQLPNYRVDGATRQLVMDLRLAKTMAVETGYEAYVVFDATQSAYDVVQDSNHNGSYDPGDTVLKTIRIPESYKGIEFYTHPGASGPVTFDGDVATFKPRGTANGGRVFLRPSQDAGVREDRQRCVTVISTARAVAKRWNGSDFV